MLMHINAAGAHNLPMIVNLVQQLYVSNWSSVRLTIDNSRKSQGQPTNQQTDPSGHY